MAEDAGTGMAATPDSGLGEVDFSEPSLGRVTDFLLGGSYNFAVDRMTAGQLASRLPDLEAAVRSVRSFLRRAVRYMVESGVRQFLDLGSGLPTGGNVHEVAQALDPDCSVVYVENDGATVAHGRTLLAATPGARMIRADFCEPDQVLRSPEVTGLIDFEQPVGLLMVSVLHHLSTDRDAAEIVARYRKALVPGSFLVVSSATSDSAAPERVAAGINARTSAEIVQVFDGFEPVEPGLVHVTRWRPDAGTDADGPVARMPGLAGVGRLSDRASEEYTSRDAHATNMENVPR
ncbi:MAG: SAM-dependent methyltransferase [Actinocatenispora sp.]